MTIVKAAFTALVILLTSTIPAWAGAIEDGLAAMERGEFSAAFKHWDIAEKRWRPLAEQGDAEAQFNLGVMLLNGYGVSQDEAEGLRLIGEAAEKGYSDAQATYFLVHLSGQIPQQDMAELFIWVHKAADQDNPVSQFLAGLMLETGIGVPQDRDKAFEWYQKAAENDVAQAQFRLGESYYYGSPFPRDEALGCLWSSRAAKQGHEEAQKTAELFCFRYFFDLFNETERLINAWQAALRQ